MFASYNFSSDSDIRSTSTAMCHLSYSDRLIWLRHCTCFPLPAERRLATFLHIRKIEEEGVNPGTTSEVIVLPIDQGPSIVKKVILLGQVNVKASHAQA